MLPEDLELSLVSSPDVIPRLTAIGQELVATRKDDIQLMLNSLHEN